jgi:hypothetical protein
MRVTINGSGGILTHGDSLSDGGLIEFPINEPPEFDDTLAAYTVTGSSPSRKLTYQGHEIAVETPASTAERAPNTAGTSVGFAWHWNLGSQTIAAGDTWTSSNAGAPTIDFDPQGFFDPDSSGAITPAEGGAGLYAVFVTAKFTSAVATGYVSVDAEGPAFKQAVPVRFDDGTNMHAIWQGLLDLGDGDNTLDVQHIINESSHDITLIRVDVRVQRLAATPG